MSTKYIYDGRFKGNILVVGRTECGKTTFVQKLALYDFFGKLKTAKWISGIRLNASREAEIESNFSCEVSFFYPNEINELGDLLEEFKLEVETEETTNDDNANIFGEVIDRDRLIVFDNVSGLADNSNRFASFLTRTSLWINRLFIELAYKNEKVCLTLDCSNTNRDGPRSFRSEADNPNKQICYFNTPTDEQVYS